MCIYIYIYMYVYIRIYMYLYIYIYLYFYIYIYQVQGTLVTLGKVREGRNTGGNCGSLCDTLRCRDWSLGFMFGLRFGFREDLLCIDRTSGQMLPAS